MGIAAYMNEELRNVVLVGGLRLTLGLRTTTTIEVRVVHL